MCTAIRAILLAAAIMLAAPGVGAATDAAQVGAFMKVPPEVWTNINRFVFLVALGNWLVLLMPGRGHFHEELVPQDQRAQPVRAHGEVEHLRPGMVSRLAASAMANAVCSTACHFP